MASVNIDPEFQRLIPPLTQEEFLLLTESVTKEGCREALMVWDNLVVDGHHRHKICS